MSEATNVSSSCGLGPAARPPLIGISMGDPCGVGAEVIVKALADPELRRLGRFVVYGLSERMHTAAADARIKPYWFDRPQSDAMPVDSGVVVANFADYADGYWSPPRPSADAGAASLAFFDEAIEAARAEVIDAIVTGPIHKGAWRRAGCRFPGHTDKLADAFGVRRFTMMFAADGLRVALASVHLGLFELRNRFTIGLVFQPIDLLHDALRRWFGVDKPRIGVAGLNPHAGEDGRFGDEEARVIVPAIQMARNAGIHVEGPLSADTLFTPEMRRRFDGIVAMYHDQGLIPVKMATFHSAVNVTLGLPVIRTSVDHGTAFDIAGTNQAAPGSMASAIRLACDMAQKKLVRPATPPPVALPHAGG